MYTFFLLFKEKKIFELKKKNQELDKFKFVLDFKIRELKQQVCLYVRVYVYVYFCLCVHLYMYIYIHIYAHTKVDFYLF
jgi:hypothetical protein